MARVLVYKRTANRHPDTSSLPGNKVQNEMAEKEVAGAASSTHTTENSKLFSNYFDVSECNESLLSEEEDISDTNRSISNDRSESSDDISQPINLKRKRTPARDKLDISLNLTKKQRLSCEITKNKNTDCITENKDLNLINDELKRKSKKRKSKKRKSKKRKRVEEKSDSKTVDSHKSSSGALSFAECDICFLQFEKYVNCSRHYLYFAKVGNYECKICKQHFPTRDKVSEHASLSHVRKTIPSQLEIYRFYCNFCNRNFITKKAIQSHLFHSHKELIYTSSVSNVKNHETTFTNISSKSNILQDDENKKTHDSDNEFSIFDVKCKKSDTSINSDNKLTHNDNTVKTNESILESSSNETCLSKKLRQPTLTEYLDICKKKSDTNTVKDELNVTNSGSPISDLPEDVKTEEIAKAMTSKEIADDKQVDSVKATSSSQFERTKSPSVKQEELKTTIKVERQSPRKPFVRLHADALMVKSYLENLSDKMTNIKKTSNEDSDIDTLQEIIPYKLRPKDFYYKGKYCFTRKRRPSKIFKKPLKTESDCETIQNDVNLDDIVPNIFSNSIYEFKGKDCIISLTRCDNKLKNRHPVETKVETDITQDTLPITELNSMPSEKNDIQNNTKELETTVEPLIVTPNTENMTPAKTTPAETTPAETAPAEMTPEVENHIENKFWCKICNKSLPSKISKRIHIKSFHVGYMSSICKARYTLRHKLLQHYMSEHITVKNQCCICNEFYDNYLDLKRHLIVHCLRYIQKNTDKYPVDVEINCSAMMKTKYFSSNAIPSSELHCLSQNLNEKTESNRYSTESSKVPKLILKVSHSRENTETIIPDKIIQHNNPCEIPSNEKLVEKNIQHDNSCEFPSNEKRVEKNIQHDNSREITSDEKFVDNQNNIVPLALNEGDVANEIIDEDSLMIDEETRSAEESRNYLDREKIIAASNIDDISESQALTNDLNIFEKENPINISANNQNVWINSDTADAYPCNVCGKRFYKRKNLEQHLRTFSSNTVNECPICKTSFTSKRLLQSHITAAHVPQLSNNYDFHCMFCNQGFFKKHDLRCHVLHLHSQRMLEIISPHAKENKEGKDGSGNRPVTCSVCKLIFETLDRYVEHRMYYFRNHKFTCTLCRKDFYGMYMYHHHYKLTHYTEAKRKMYKFVCEICKEGFNHELHFYSHNLHLHPSRENVIELTEEFEESNEAEIISKTRQKIKNLFMNQPKQLDKLAFMHFCEICHVIFTNVNEMEEHMLLYSNDGDFKCNICNRQRKTLDLLEQHKKLTHTCFTVENKHTCQICNEVLPTAISLSCHEKHLHPTETSRDARKCKNCNQKLSSSKKHQCTNSGTSSAFEANRNMYNCFYCDKNFTSYHMIQMHIIQMHFNRLAEHLGLKYKFISQNSNQKQTNQKRLEELLGSPSNITSSIQMSKDVPNSTSVIKYVSRIESNSKKGEARLHISNVPAKKVSNPAPNKSEAKSSKKNITESNNQPKASTSTQSELMNQVKKLFIMYLSKPSSAAIARALKETPTPSTNQPKVSSTNSSVRFIAEPIKEPRNLAIPISEKINRLINEKLTPIINYSDYSTFICPFCTLKYPSLVFFHAHLRYAHADSIRVNMISSESDQSSQKMSKIECLLCSFMTNDEIAYKKHLQDVHLKICLSAQRMRNNTNNSFTTEKDFEAKSKTPEIITLDDDNMISSVKREVNETLDAPEPTEENKKIGKLKVKSFAKIIENLSTNRNLEL